MFDSPILNTQITIPLKGTFSIYVCRAVYQERTVFVPNCLFELKKTRRGERIHFSFGFDILSVEAFTQSGLLGI